MLPAPGAPWLRHKSKKRKLLSGSDQADAEVPLAGSVLRVDQASAADWEAQLRSAAALPEPPSAEQATTGVLKDDTDDWRKRLLDEARQVEKLVTAAVQNEGLLRAGGRAVREERGWQVAHSLPCAGRESKCTAPGGGVATRCLRGSV